MGKLLGQSVQRDKMVNFRLSEEELAKLRQEARENGARSVGEHLRNVIFSTKSSEDLVITAALERIKVRLQELQQLKPEARHEAV